MLSKACMQIRGTKYVMYRYDNFSKVPSSAATAAAGAAQVWNITASATSWSTSQSVLTSAVAAYRAFKA